MTAFLVEHFGEGIITRYYAGWSDWCDNPNHARKYAIALPAAMIVLELLERSRPLQGSYRVAEHMWVDA